MKQDKDDLEKELYRFLGLFGAPSSDQLNASREQIHQRLGAQAGTSLDKAIPGMSRRNSSSGGWWRLAPAACVVVVVLFTGNLLRNMDSLANVEGTDGLLYRVTGDTLQAVHAGDAIHAGQIVRSNGKTGSVIALSDGSRVEMRPESEVLLERANDGLRVRVRNGDVIVNAAKQATGHLHVWTKDVTVSVVGTIFLVTTGEQGSRVAVIDGEVRVEQGGASTRLRRGEQVATNPLMETQLAPDEISWSRNAGMHLAMLRQPTVAQAQIQAGSVTGTVRMASGNPATGVRVTALRKDSIDAALRAMVGLAETDAAGLYRLDNIPPGNYYITAGRVDLPTYYPGTLEVAKGAVIAIVSAASVSGIDFVLHDTSTLPPPPMIQGGLTLPANQEFRVRMAPRDGASQTASRINDRIRRAPIAGSILSPGGSLGGASAWWTNEDFVKQLGLTDEQRNKIVSSAEPYAQFFAQNKSDLDKEEEALKRMVAPDWKGALPVSAQEDRVLQLRREREAANTHVMLDMAEILTDAQSAQLKAELPQLQKRRQRQAVFPANPPAVAPDRK